MKLAVALTLAGCATTTPMIPDAETRAWWAITAALSNDTMEGRDTGSRGYDRAAALVAEWFQAAGLNLRSPHCVNGGADLGGTAPHILNHCSGSGFQAEEQRFLFGARMHQEISSWPCRSPGMDVSSPSTLRI